MPRQTNMVLAWALCFSTTARTTRAQRTLQVRRGIGPEPDWGGRHQPEITLDNRPRTPIAASSYPHRNNYDIAHSHRHTSTNTAVESDCAWQGGWEGLLGSTTGRHRNNLTRWHHTVYSTVHSEPSYSAQTQRSTPAFSRGRLSDQNPHTVLSRICMKLDIKTVH